MNSVALENAESDHHAMIYSILKLTYVKVPPKKITYPCFKTFHSDRFREDLASNLSNAMSCIHGNTMYHYDYNMFEKTFQHTLLKHAPLKTKILRGNDKPFMGKSLRKSIATRTRLLNAARKSNNDDDYKKYKKQRNMVKKLSFKMKREYYQTLNPKKLKFNKQFWKTFKPYFSDKVMSAEKIILVENNEIISSDSVIAETMNEYFSTITDTLNIKKWPEPDGTFNISDKISIAVAKYKNHPSIIKIKENNATSDLFKFQHITPDIVKNKIRYLSSSKSTRGYIPINILKDNIDIYCSYLTDHFNRCINDCMFPSDMKLQDITPIFKDTDRTNKKMYRPISILLALLKVLERIIYDQISEYMSDRL